MLCILFCYITITICNIADTNENNFILVLHISKLFVSLHHQTIRDMKNLNKFSHEHLFKLQTLKAKLKLNAIKRASDNRKKQGGL